MADSIEDEVLITTEHDEEQERDLLLQHSDGDNEETVLRFLQALNLQVIGACRADERLIPLLKTNVSNCAAEDRFLAHLIQHFEAQEIGMLARCLCMPLVSIRVGRIIKQGNLLCPTSVRGNLNLTLLPSSNLRISFIGDNGISDKLATLSSSCDNSTAMIDELPADTTGRSFAIKLPNSQVYFWCSEKSRLIGTELLTKMNDLLERKPSLAELTGISETRLDSFATYFREFLLGSNQIATSAAETPGELSETNQSLQISSSEDSGYIQTPLVEIPSLPFSMEWTTLSSSSNQFLPLYPCTDSSSSFYYSHPPCLQNSEIPPLPPLSTLLSATRSLNPPHNLLDQLPLSISLATVSTSQQIPTFTPLICDSIVHIPTIAVCSSGQGYLVPTSAESMLEKGARETLQLLLSSAQTNPWSRDMMLPGVSPMHEWAEATEGESMDFDKALLDVKRRYGESSNQSEGSEGLKGVYPDDVNNDSLG